MIAMGSYSVGKKEVCEWIRERFSTERDDTILDVGACDGKWRKLLPDYVMDAVEVFEPYAKALTGYRKVYNRDIRRFRYDYYDLIIFGDVIEHLEVKDAQKVLEYAKTRCLDMVIAVPWLYKQDEVDGNKWQKHLQDDLTPEIFEERYQGFEVLYDAGNYCYYHWARQADKDVVK